MQAHKAILIEMLRVHVSNVVIQLGHHKSINLQASVKDLFDCLCKARTIRAEDGCFNGIEGNVSFGCVNSSASNLTP